MPVHAEGVPPAKPGVLPLVLPEDLHDHLVGRIKALRDELIDISARNPLISFKHSERGAGFIRVVDERPDCLFESLQSGEMQFEPLPDPQEQPADEKTADFQIALEAARLTDPDYLAAMQKLGEYEADEGKVAAIEHALRSRVRRTLGLPQMNIAGKLNILEYASAHNINPSYELTTRPDDAAAHLADDKIRVLYVKDRLEARLRTIHDKFRAHASESGIHTLYIAFGFIEWPEADAAATSHHAPLLLMPVQLRRQLVRNRYLYRLSGRYEDLSVNIALRELLRRRFGIALPVVDDADTPESYFSKLVSVLDDSSRLQLRRFVTIGIFPFPRMALWADLDPERWPEQSLVNHEQVALLLGARGEDRQPGDFSPEYPIQDEELEAIVPPLILPADISQHSALVDVVNGKSLAIEGPPGTGKSQTIANMIAVALDRGKRVLFLAEKRAALEVVAKRLTEHGLGPLMLELHSDQATRGEVMKSLRERVNAPPATHRSVIAEKRADLNRQRDTLRRYIGLLRREVGSLGRPVNALYWRYMALDDALTLPYSLHFRKVDRADEISALDLTGARQALDAVETTAKQIEERYGSLTATRWHAAAKLPNTPFGQQEVRAHLDKAIIAINNLQQFRQEFEGSIGLPFPCTRSEAEVWLEALACLPADVHRVCPQRLRTALRSPELMREMISRLKRYGSLLTRARSIHPTPLTADVGAVEALDVALARLEPRPNTVRDLEQQRVAASAWLATLRRLEAQLRPVLAQVHVEAESTPAYAVRMLVAVLGLVRTARPEVLRLRTPELLQDDARQRILNGVRIATNLKSRQAAIEARIDLNAAIRLGAAALEEQATTVAEAGPMRRLFSSAVKLRLRRARALYIGEPPERGVLSELLRTTAAWVGDAEAFRNDSALARFFGAAWDGHHSDVAALQEALVLISSAAEKLLLAGLDAPLRVIAGAPTVTLQATAIQADLDESSRQALGAIEAASTLPQALAEAERRERQLRAVAEAARTAGIRPEAALTQDQPLAPLFIELLALHQALLIRPDPPEDWSRYNGPDEDPQSIEATLEIADAILATEVPPVLATAIKGAADPASLVGALIAAQRQGRPRLHAMDQAWRAFAEMVDTDAEAFFGVADAASLPWPEIRAKLAQAHDDSSGLAWFADLQGCLREAEERKVRFVYHAFVAAKQKIDSLADAFELLLVRTLLKEYLAVDGATLQSLGGTTLEQARKRFRDLDDHLMSLEAQRIVADRLTDRVAPGLDIGPVRTWTDYALVRHQLTLQRPMPIRDLIARAGVAMQVLKPVWLMSPMSVAQYVPPGAAAFDLVIIDEASQMRPEVAIGSIARGTQLVVVGDPKQLPPTEFFQVQDGPPADDDDYATQSESILDLALARLSHVRRLRWHYRSQHASLITFSNRTFYDRDLVVFPNAVTEDPVLGVKHTFVEGASYASGINRKEAEAVLEAAVGLIYAHPDLSLGIATMNVDQRDLIFAEFERIDESDAIVRAYVERHARGIEPFFVKNLENVQGDERDIILVSTLYGPPPGGGSVMQRFGPINTATGHRRLNVLFTRAKMSTMIFTSLRPTDIVVGDNSREGIRAFRGYLDYAAGGALVDDAVGGEPDSDFEVFVADQLRAAGYEVVPQVGVERFRIDLGVRHASYPLGFLAGIECDGATYHSSLTVRDRDRIRQDVLEGLGWRIYRVWSTDWFNDRDREIARLLRWLGEHRLREAARYESRRAAIAFAERVTPEAERAAEPEAATASAEVAPLAEQSAPEPMDDIETQVLISAPQPEGRKRSLNGIDYYEVQPGYYEVWIDGRMLGDVQRLSRAPVLGARLYGDRVVAPVTHYQATVEQSKEVFNTDDIYEAVREVARRAALSPVPTRHTQEPAVAAAV